MNREIRRDDMKFMKAKQIQTKDKQKNKKSSDAIQSNRTDIFENVTPDEVVEESNISNELPQDITSTTTNQQRNNNTEIMEHEISLEELCCSNSSLKCCGIFLYRSLILILLSSIFIVLAF